MTFYNSFERLQIYQNCELNGTIFKKSKRISQKWICLKHNKMLISTDGAQCLDLCCLICPIDNRCEDVKKVPVKIKEIIW